MKNGQNDIKVKLMSKTKNRTTKSTVNGFQCKFCLTESFQSDVALKKHIRDKHMKQMPFTCNICNVTFIDENVLKRHQEIHHIWQLNEMVGNPNTLFPNIEIRSSIPTRTSPLNRNGPL